MIVTNLHREPIALDTVLHRELRLKNDVSPIQLIQPFTSFMVSVSEFADAASTFPILFVRAAPDALGKDTVAPVAVFGMKPGENLFAVDGKWDAPYLPAMMRAYPFTMARIEGSDRWAMVFDNSWEGISRTEGQPLFDEQGEASELLNNVHKFVQDLESDIERTRQFCSALMELKLLKPMRFDATLANGETLSVDGFMTADEEALRKLTDAQIALFYRNGLLGLVQTHLLSLNNMRRLLDRRMVQSQAEAAAPAAADVA
jgi:hypothetical protein